MELQSKTPVTQNIEYGVDTSQKLNSPVSTQVIKPSLLEIVQQSPRATALGIWLAGVYLLLGYEVVFIGTVAGLPAFKAEFGVLEGKEAIIPSLWLSLWAASGPMGQMAGSLIGGWLQDVIGRRRNIFVFTLFEIGTIFMSYFADRLSTPEGRRSLYFAGKLLEGAAMGSVIGTANTYISENFPLNLRASILSLPTIYTLLGEFIGALIIQSRVMILNEESYRLPIAAQWAFSVIPLVAVLTLPESPVWLMRQDKWEQAQKACSRLEGGDGSSWFSRLKLDLEEERNETGQREETSYLDCFRRRANARRTGIVIFANLLTELFGLPLLGHSTYLLELAGMSSSDAYDGFISGCVVGVVANLGAFWMVPRFGRRSLTFSTLACITILWLTVGISACFKASSAFWYMVVALTLVTGIASLGVWPVSYIIGAETSLLSLRAKTQGIGWCANGLGTGLFAFFLPYIYNPGSGNLAGKVGFVYSGFAALALTVSWLIIPEMKDRTPAEVDRMFELGLPAWQFRKFERNA